MFLHLGVGLKILQPLVHEIKSVVDQLRGLFGSHDAGGVWCLLWNEDRMKSLIFDGFNGDLLARL